MLESHVTGSRAKGDSRGDIVEKKIELHKARPSVYHPRAPVCFTRTVIFAGYRKKESLGFPHCWGSMEENK